MAQTRPSPTLSRGFTRLGRFLAPYGVGMSERFARISGRRNRKTDGKSSSGWMRAATRRVAQVARSGHVLPL